jgi:hypothetical protein
MYAPVSEHSQEVLVPLSGKGYQQRGPTVFLLSEEYGRNLIMTVGRDSNLFRSYRTLLQYFFQVTSFGL